MTTQKKEDIPSKDDCFSTSRNVSEQNRYDRIMLVRDMISKGFSVRSVAKSLGMSRNTIRRYLSGDPELLCKWHGNCNRVCKGSIETYISFITGEINAGHTPKEIYDCLTSKYHYHGSFHAFYAHLKRNAKENGWIINTRVLPQKALAKAADTISRKGIFNYLWNAGPLSSEHMAYLFTKFPILGTIKRCICEFRDIFKRTCVNRLWCFIEKYSMCGVASIEAFAKAMLNDIEAIENAVSYDWSNGFVEGTNNKLKLIKRSMFGRCSRKLLEAKLLL